MAAADLAPAAPRIVALVRLLGSDRDGEAMAALHGLRRLLAARGATLHELADAVARGLAEPAQAAPKGAPEPEEGDGWVSDLAAVAARWADLRPAEQSLVRTLGRLARAGVTPTPRQQAWLGAIRDRLDAEPAT